jgi:hypothetical protein
VRFCKVQCVSRHVVLRVQRRRLDRTRRA